VEIGLMSFIDGRYAVTLRRIKERNGSLAHNLPIIKNAEQWTFNKAAQALGDEYTINNRKSLAMMQRRITKPI
jgi:hypothetical protein